MVYLQVGTVVDECQLKRPRVGTRPPTDLPGQLHPAQVTFDHEEKDEQHTCVNGTVPIFCGLTGPGELGRGCDHLGHCSGGVLIKSQSCQTSVLEGPYYELGGNCMPLV
jgi:hypothetical protein